MYIPSEVRSKSMCVCEDVLLDTYPVFFSVFGLADANYSKHRIMGLGENLSIKHYGIYHSSLVEYGKRSKLGFSIYPAPQVFINFKKEDLGII